MFGGVFIEICQSDVFSFIYSRHNAAPHRSGLSTEYESVPAYVYPFDFATSFVLRLSLLCVANNPSIPPTAIRRRRAIPTWGRPLLFLRLGTRVPYVEMSSLYMLRRYRIEECSDDQKVLQSSLQDPLLADTYVKVYPTKCVGMCLDYFGACSLCMVY